MQTKMSVTDELVRFVGNRADDGMMLGLGFDDRVNILQTLAAAGVGNVERGEALEFVITTFAKAFPNDVGRPIMTRSINSFLESIVPFPDGAENAEAYTVAFTPATIGEAFRHAGIDPDDRTILPTHELKPGDLVELVSAPEGLMNELRDNALKGVFLVGYLYLQAPIGFTVQGTATETISLHQPDDVTRKAAISLNARGCTWNVIERPYLPPVPKGEPTSVGESLVDRHSV